MDLVKAQGETELYKALLEQQKEHMVILAARMDKYSEVTTPKAPPVALTDLVTALHMQVSMQVACCTHALH